MNRARFRRTLVVLALFGVAALILSTHVPFCPMAALLGVPCPGCGLSRATLALFRGNLREAVRFHPLVFVIAPAFIWGIGSAAWDYVRGPCAYYAPRPWFTSRVATALASLLLLATLSVWGLRFLGYFGGPAPVLTLSAWLHSRAR